MTIAEIKQQILKIYKKHGIPEIGIAEDEGTCTALCCYPNAKKHKLVAKKINHILEQTELSTRAFVGELPDPTDIEYFLTKLRCKHEYFYNGVPSNTSAGMGEEWKCHKCDSVQYRNIQKYTQTSPWSL